jgi:hypothetical protein
LILIRTGCDLPTFSARSICADTRAMAPEAYAELLRLKRSGYSYSSRHARKYLKQMAQEVGREMQRVLQGDTAAPCDIIFMIVWHVLTEIHIHNIVSHLCSLAKKYWPYGCPDLHT